MVSLLKRQLTDEEKAIVLRRFGRVCYANGHAIPEEDQIQYGHIHAHGLGGDSELNNVAPMCAKHNREKGQLPLEDFRVKLQLNKFFASGDKLTLGNLLTHLQKEKSISEFGQSVTVNPDEDKIVVESSTNKMVHALYTCPITGWKYFYATLDVSIVDSDDEADDRIGLQPRYLISDKVFKLFRHFQYHPVLQPAVGRLGSVPT